MYKYLKQYIDFKKYGREIKLAAKKAKLGIKKNPNVVTNKLGSMVTITKNIMFQITESQIIDMDYNKHLEENMSFIQMKNDKKDKNRQTSVDFEEVGDL